MSGERRIIIPPGAFNQCYRPCLSAGQFRQIYFGGAGSGKSVFLAGRAAHRTRPIHPAKCTALRPIRLLVVAGAVRRGNHIEEERIHPDRRRGHSGKLMTITWERATKI